METNYVCESCGDEIFYDSGLDSQVGDELPVYCEDCDDTDEDM